jgi:ubiquitin-protein ligase E3 C
MRGAYNLLPANPQNPTQAIAQCLHDLATLPVPKCSNLVFLKTFKDDVADLGLSFTITDSVLGKPREVGAGPSISFAVALTVILRPQTLLGPVAQVDLAPNGYNIPVTVENRLAYIHRVADYRLNQQIREPAAAFLRWAAS